MSGKYLLLVEDDPDVGETLSSLLSRLGYSVRLARDGQKALGILRSGEQPAVIVLDLMMPNMDGQRFRTAQCEDPALAAIPTIVVTADQKATAEKLGVSVCLHKPFDVERLIREVERHFA
jgi:CheY-like chemotaxis protein